MKEIVVVSGKGGTGKTVVTSALVRLFGDVAIGDLDVDASNLHLIIPFQKKKEESFSGCKMPVVDEGKCDGCNICGEHCRFGAIEAGKIDPWSCDHCGLCMHVCPQDAISMVPEENGRIFIGKTPYGPMVYGELEPGAENSGKLVAEIRKRIRGMDRVLAVLDGPPGIGCPVISSITGSQGIVVVSEPTQSGLHDLERVLELVDHFKVKAVLAINKWDLNEEMSSRIEGFARSKGLKFVKIPFVEEVVDCIKKGRDPLCAGVERFNGPLMRLKELVSQVLL